MNYLERNSVTNNGIRRNIREDALNALMLVESVYHWISCTMKLYSSNLHKRKIVPSAFYVCRHFVQDRFTWHAVGKVFAADVFMPVRWWWVMINCAPFAEHLLLKRTRWISNELWRVLSCVEVGDAEASRKLLPATKIGRGQNWKLKNSKITH